MSLSCSCYGHLWIVSYEGLIYFRSGVSRQSPSGQKWTKIENPTSTSVDLNGAGAGMRQVTAGKNSVWALNSGGAIFYRSDITETTPMGNKWHSIPGNMSHISISMANQVNISK
jgi:tectonin beta-propeller repeat-containing protein 1